MESTDNPKDMSNSVSVSSQASPQIQDNKNTPSDDGSSKCTSDNGTSKCINCVKLKNEVDFTKQIWKKHLKEEVEKAVKKYRDCYEDEKKKNLILVGKEKDLQMKIQIKDAMYDDANEKLVKEKNINAELSNTNAGLAKALDKAIELLLKNKHYRIEAEELLTYILNSGILSNNNKLLIDNACQTDNSEVTSADFRTHLEEISVKKGQLDHAIASLLELANPPIHHPTIQIPNEINFIGEQMQNSPRGIQLEHRLSNPTIQIPNEINFIGEQMNNSGGIKHRLERSDTISPPSLWEPSHKHSDDNDSDIEIVGETPGHKASTPEKDIIGDLVHPSSRGVKRRYLAGKENDVHLNGDNGIPALSNKDIDINYENSKKQRKILVASLDDFLQSYDNDSSKTSLIIVNEFFSLDSLEINLNSDELAYWKGILVNYVDDWMNKK